MNTKRLFSCTATFSALAIAAIVGQSLFQSAVSATPDNNNSNFGLANRVEALEQHQQEDDRDFMLIDATLNDLQGQVDTSAVRIASLRANLRALRLELNRLEIPVETLNETTTEARSIQQSAFRAGFRAMGARTMGARATGVRATGIRIQGARHQ